MKQTFLKTVLSLLIAFSFINCEKEEIITEPESNIETVSVSEAFNLFSQSSKTNKTSKTSHTQFAIPDLDKISQEEIINSNELLTILPAFTFQGIHSRILLIKIDGEIKSVVFSMVKDESSNSEEFSGMIYIHTLQKEYINTFKAENGILVSRFKKPTDTKSSKSSFSKGDDDCVGIACGMRGEEVTIIAKKNTKFEFNWMFQDDGGGSGEGGQSWDYTGDSSGGDSGGGKTTPETTCNEGYIKDSYGNCVELIVLESPEKAIKDLSEYLKCLNKSQGANFTIYVNQPTQNSNEPISKALDVGHTFISLQQGDNIASFGFYPAEGIGYSKSVNGIMGDNSTSSFDLSITIPISASKLNEIINYSVNFSQNVTYNLQTNNCSNFGIYTANMAGLPISVSNATSNWVLGNGANPGALGEQLRDLALPNDATRNVTGGNSPSNNCD